MTIKREINKLFRTLRKQGVLAEQDHCCRSCAWGTIGEGGDENGFVFTVRQNKDLYNYGEQYIYGKYPSNILTLITEQGLDYKQEKPDDAILVLQK